MSIASFLRTQHTTPVSALNRCAVAENAEVVVGIDMDPVSSDRVLAETLECLCMAAFGVGVAVKQIIGDAPGGTALNDIAERYAALSDRKKTKFKSAA